MSTHYSTLGNGRLSDMVRETKLIGQHQNGKPVLLDILSACSTCLPKYVPQICTSSLDIQIPLYSHWMKYLATFDLFTGHFKKLLDMSGNSGKFVYTVLYTLGHIKLSLWPVVFPNELGKM